MKNKPSWENNDLSDADYCQTDQSAPMLALLLYCGPGYRRGRVHRFTYDLRRNLYGSASKAAIHYRKVADTNGEVEVLILGFTPNYTSPAFSLSDKPGLAHPLFDSPSH